MKKGLMILTALLVLLTFSACGKKAGESAYELYAKGTEEILAADSMQVNAKLKTKMQGGGVNQEINMDMSMKMITQDGKLQAQIETSGEQFGLPGTMTIYIKDNETYMDVQGKKIKMQLPEGTLNGLTSNSQPVKLESSAVKEQKTEDVNGKKKLTMTISGDAMMETAKQQMSELLETYPGAQMTVGDVFIEAVVGSDGKLETISMKLNISATVAGQTMTMDMEMEAEYVQIGNVTIDFPADLDTYVVIAIPAQ